MLSFLFQISKFSVTPAGLKVRKTFETLTCKYSFNSDVCLRASLRSRFASEDPDKGCQIGVVKIKLKAVNYFVLSVAVGVSRTLHVVRCHICRLIWLIQFVLLTPPTRRCISVSIRKFV